MTYRNKTIKKHSRGNWFTRFWHNGKQYSIYGRTQLETYDKLKIVVDRIESETILQKSERILAKLQMPQVMQIVVAPQAVPVESKTKSYTFAQWYDEWLNSYKNGSVRKATIQSFNAGFRYLKDLHKIPLNEITNLMLCKAIQQGSCCRMKDKVRNILRQMFSIAFNNRIVEINPAHDLPRPKAICKKTKTSIDC